MALVLWRRTSWTAVGLASLLALTGAASSAIPVQPPPQLDADAIIRRSIAVNAADWRAELLYNHCERDDDGDSARTYDVVMLEGTPYERLVATDGRPLSPEDAQTELRKQAAADAERRAESADARTRRVTGYRNDHARLHALFQQVTDAFVFTLRGTEENGGRRVFRIQATPRPTYEPPTRDARVLRGMEVEFIVDAETYHWVKATAHVTRPISIAGLLVRVEPGTIVVVEKAPADPDVWLNTHLHVQSNSRILLFLSHRTYHDERYFDHRRSPMTATAGCQEQ